MLEQVRLGSLTADFLSPDEFLETCRQWLVSGAFHHVVTLNPEMVMAAQNDEDFRQAVEKADLRVPDGAGLTWARWYLRSAYWPWLPSLVVFMFHRAQRITGVDMLWDLAALCSQNHQALYLLGGTARQVQRTAKKLRLRFPNITIHTSPEHRYDRNGPGYIVEDIQAKKPAVLLVAYGVPKQTVWLNTNRDKLTGVSIAAGVGGAFAMLSEEVPRAPRWLRQLNLEWVWRLMLEPQRLPRIWQAAVQFPLLIRKQKQKEKGIT